ncbi:MAG: type II secretion system F family protein [Candidatus Micrarchaeota archaeon]|nr:type II secretion system F family protein [Candidatus Micrarchaeota archaeon]
MRIPLMLFSKEAASKIARPFRGAGALLLSVMPGVAYDLKAIGYDIDAEEYSFAAFVSALVWGLLFGVVTYVVLQIRGLEAQQQLMLSLATFLFFTMFAFILHMSYPSIIAKKQAEKTDKELIYALRDMLAQVKSGMPFYVALSNIAKSDYGNVSKELSVAVKSISAGESEKRALERVILNTKSDYLKRTIWQVLVAIESGASMSAALRSALDTLMNYQMQAIKNYASELNFAILFYMFFAAVLPSIGITLLVLLISFTSANITQEIFFIVVIISLVVQMAIIGFIKSERPSLY